MPRKLWLVSFARVRLGRASREAESPRVDTDRVRHKCFCYKRKLNVNQTNENTSSHFWHECAQPYFWGKKVSPYCNNCIFLIFSLKRSNNSLHHWSASGWQSSLSIIFSPSFCIFFAKIHYFFNVASCKSVSFCYNCVLSLREYWNEQKVTVSDVIPLCNICSSRYWGVLYSEDKY